MRASTNNTLSFGRLSRAFLRLLLGKRLLLVLLLLVAVLLCGHLSLRADEVRYDRNQRKVAADVEALAQGYVASYQTPHMKEKVKTDPKLQNTVAYWVTLEKQSKQILLSYTMMDKYHMDRQKELGADWHKLYHQLFEGYRQGILPEHSDVLLRIGEARLIENLLYNGARQESGLPPRELRPRNSRPDYAYAVPGGTNALSVALLLALLLLLHTSFSQDYDCGSFKLIETLPVPAWKRNAARLVAQGASALVLVLLCAFVVSLTFPAGSEDRFFLVGQGPVLTLEKYAQVADSLPYASYVLPSTSWLLRAFGLYLAWLLVFGLLALCLSARLKNSILALFLPVTLLLFGFLPNTLSLLNAQHPNPVAALLSPRLVLEKQAALGSTQLLLLLLGTAVLLVLLTLPGRLGRRR